MTDEDAKRETIVFYRSFFDAAEDMTLEGRDAFYRACFKLAFYDIDTPYDELPTEAVIAFRVAKPSIKIVSEHYDISKIRSEAGKKGGRPRKDSPSGDTPDETDEKQKKQNEKQNEKQVENPTKYKALTKASTKYSDSDSDLNLSLPPVEKRGDMGKKNPPSSDGLSDVTATDGKIDGDAFRAFIDEFGIAEDNYNPGDLHDMDFRELASAFRLSGDYLQKFKSCRCMSWICKNYKSIVAGKYEQQVDDGDGKKDKRSAFDRLRALRDEEA